MRLLTPNVHEVRQGRLTPLSTWSKLLHPNVLPLVPHLVRSSRRRFLSATARKATRVLAIVILSVGLSVTARY